MTPATHKKKGAVVCVMLYMMLTTACTGNTSITQECHHIDHRQWYADDTVHVQLPPIMETGLYNESFMLRTDRNYPYKELFLKVEHKLASPDKTNCDTICLHLSDSSTGVNLLQYESVQNVLYLMNGQHWEIRITHLMHRNPLPSISDVGVCVTPLKTRQ